MNYKRRKPLFVRIAKVEERLKEEPKTRFGFLKDYTKVISISAFIISIATTIYSWRRDNLQAHEAARRQFDSTMQSYVDMGIKNFEFSVKNKDEPNVGSASGWFNAQSAFIGNKSLHDLSAIDDPSITDYLLAGNVLSYSGQFSKASDLFNRAIKIGQQHKKEHDSILHKIMNKFETMIFGEKIDVSLSDEQRIHDLASAYTSWGSSLYSDFKSAEAEKAFAAAIQTYSESDQNDAIKRNFIAYIHKIWGETLILLDCKSSLEHLKAAEEYFPYEKRLPENTDWKAIQYELSWGSSHCGSDGKVHDVPTYTGNSALSGVTGPWERPEAPR